MFKLTVQRGKAGRQIISRKQVKTQVEDIRQKIRNRGTCTGGWNTSTQHSQDDKVVIYIHWRTEEIMRRRCVSRWGWFGNVSRRAGGCGSQVARVGGNVRGHLVDRWRMAGLESSSEMHSPGGSEKWLEAGTEGQTEQNKNNWGSCDNCM